jgi:hypothetical protein
MRTLIIPCAGRSSRFPNMKPKWMLTHPDGKLMVEKSLEGISLASFGRIVITILKEHVEKHEAKIVLSQIFSKNKKVEILVLDEPTSCQAETVQRTLHAKRITGPFVVKDADNAVSLKLGRQENFVAGLHIPSFQKEIQRLSSKSFLEVNDQGIIADIIEKKISSEYICVGVYGFSDPAIFNDAYTFLSKQGRGGEIYLSHVIAYLIATDISVFRYVPVDDFEDWGTLQDWRITQLRHATYFLDIDGVLMKNVGKYGSRHWGNADETIEHNLALMKELQDRGAQIILTTSRGKKDLVNVHAALARHGIKPHQVVTDCHHAPRYLVNDYAPTNPYPCTIAVNMPRNGNLTDFLGPLP